jgi:hypothetical protein
MMEEEKKDASGQTVDFDRTDYDDGRLTFYYSRERRLERASAEVRALNESGLPQKTGLFRSLTATKPLTFVFLSIIIICVATALFSLFNNNGARRISDTEIAVSAVKGGDKSYITLKKTVAGTDPYTGAVNIAISVQGSRDTMFLETLYFSLEKEEVYRFIAPITGETLLVLAVLDDQTTLFKVNPR